MESGKKKYGFSYFAESERYAPQTEMLQVQRKPQKLRIGIPKEGRLQENRVALVPSSVGTLTGAGHEVVIERGAGVKANFSDRDYAEAGAILMDDKAEVFKSQVLIKVEPPSNEEAELMQPSQLLISPLSIPIINKEYIDTLLKKRVVAVAMEYLMDSDGTFPLVRIMSEMAGISAILTAAELLSNSSGGDGVLLGGISGVPPAKVVILGAGVVGEFATRTALGLGATVCIFDNNIYKLMRIQQRVGRQLFTSSLNPTYLEQEILNANVVIGAIHSETGSSPMVVSEDMVMKMSNGSVIIDVSIDQGGCIETSEMTTHSSPTFRKHGVIHYCVPNIASRVARTASLAVSNILTPILLNAGSTENIESLFFTNYGLRHGVYTFKGCLTNRYLAERFNLKFTDPELLVTSNL
jgi:alanine dehydrogenase